MAEQDRPTHIWWALLASIGLVDVLLWLGTAAAAPATGPYGAQHLRLSGIYAFVCACRAMLPRIDLERTVMLDHGLSSIFLGRSGATVAEICFGIQATLALHELGGVLGLPWMQTVAPLVAVLCTVAQGFCWASVISLSHLGHVVEESLWGVAFAIVAACLILAFPHAEGGLRTLIGLSAAGCVGFVIFMARVDVPMYLSRWRAQRAEGFRPLGFAEGVRDALFRRAPTRSWTTWQPEVAWLTGYFSFAVWASLAMVWMPR